MCKVQFSAFLALILLVTACTPSLKSAVVPVGASSTPSVLSFSSFSPTAQAVGGAIILEGSGFLRATGITVGGTTVSSYFLLSDAAIIIIVPSGASSGSIVVATSGGTTTSAGFTLNTSGGGTSSAPAAYHISTIAGKYISGGYYGYSGDGLVATDSALNTAMGIAVDSLGNYYISDQNNYRVRMVVKVTGTYFGRSLTAGNLYTIAGTGVTGNAGDGGFATSAQLGSPTYITVDAAGNVYFTDYANNRIRMIVNVSGTYFGAARVAGKIYGIAGTTAYGFIGDGGAASTAEFNNPAGIGVDSAGNLFVSDNQNACVRMVANATGTAFGVSTTAGFIYTVVGQGQSSGAFTNNIAASASQLNYPAGLVVDAQDNLYIEDTNNNIVMMVPQTTASFFGVAMTAGNIYSIAGTSSLTSTPSLSSPNGIAVDASGNLFIANSNDSTILEVPQVTGTYFTQSMTQGNPYVVAGFSGHSGFSQDGLVAQGNILSSGRHAIDPSGNIITIDGGSLIRKINRSDDVHTTVAGVRSYSGDGASATLATMNNPQQLATDSVGNVYLADGNTNVIRMVVKVTGTYFSRSLTAGNIYTIAGNGDNYAGDPAPATDGIGGVRAIAADSVGNVYFLTSSNDAVRMVVSTSGTYFGTAMTAGNVYTLAGTIGTNILYGDNGPAHSATLGSARAVAVDGSGNVFVTDSNCVRMLVKTSGTYFGNALTAGNIYTVAGIPGGNGYTGDDGLALQAQLGSNLLSLSLDTLGNLYIGDGSSEVVRMVSQTAGTYFGQTMSVGNIYTILGNGLTHGALTDGSLGIYQGVYRPDQIASLSNGNLVFTQESTNTVWLLQKSDGNTYRIGGTQSSQQIYSGDGGLGTSAHIAGPLGVTTDTSGNVYISDSRNNLIRKLTP